MNKPILEKGNLKVFRSAVIQNRMLSLDVYENKKLVKKIHYIPNNTASYNIAVQKAKKYIRL